MLVAVDREPLLEGELEPVAAGDAVAAPVVEVFVPHHALHTLVVAWDRVRLRFRVRVRARARVRFRVRVGARVRRS